MYAYICVNVHVYLGTLVWAKSHTSIWAIHKKVNIIFQFIFLKWCSKLWILEGWGCTCNILSRRKFWCFYLLFPKYQILTKKIVLAIFRDNYMFFRIKYRLFTYKFTRIHNFKQYSTRLTKVLTFLETFSIEKKSTWDYVMNLKT